MNNLKAIVSSIALIIINALLGHYFPPFSIFFTPLIVGLITALLAFTNIKLYYIILFVIIAITSNDILVKLTAGGTSDFEGAGLINLFFIIAVIISTIVAISILVTKRKGQIFALIFYCLMIPTASYFYISYFDFLGLTDYLNTSKTKEIAVKNKVFLNDLKFSENPIIYKNDTIRIVGGWAEKQIIVNHEKILKKYDDTSTINYTIKLKSNTSFDSLRINYRINNTDISGSDPIDSSISFNCSRSKPNVIIYFFGMNEASKNDTIINKLVISKK